MQLHIFSMFSLGVSILASEFCNYYFQRNAPLVERLADSSFFYAILFLFWALVLNPALPEWFWGYLLVSVCLIAFTPERYSLKLWPALTFLFTLILITLQWLNN